MVNYNNIWRQYICKCKKLQRFSPRLYRQRSLSGRFPFLPPRRYTWPASNVALCLLLEGGAGPFSVPAAVTELHIFSLKQSAHKYHFIEWIMYASKEESSSERNVYYHKYLSLKMSIILFASLKTKDPKNFNSIDTFIERDMAM